MQQQQQQQQNKKMKTKNIALLISVDCKFA